jgi:hypothetical protein
VVSNPARRPERAPPKPPKPPEIPIIVRLLALAREWWRRGDRVRGLGSLSVEVVSRALGERDARPRSISQARSDGSGEESRIHRNTLLENAEAGRYGAEIRRAALSRPNLKQLADELC